jgi:hypothetical protein
MFWTISYYVFMVLMIWVAWVVGGALMYTALDTPSRPLHRWIEKYKEKPDQMIIISLIWPVFVYYYLRRGRRV